MSKETGFEMRAYETEEAKSILQVLAHVFEGGIQDTNGKEIAPNELFNGAVSPYCFTVQNGVQAEGKGGLQKESVIAIKDGAVRTGDGDETANIERLGVFLGCTGHRDIPHGDFVITKN